MRSWAKSRSVVVVGLALLLAGGQTLPSQALDLEVDANTLFLEGEITSRDLGKMQRTLRQHPELRRVVLLDVPGSDDDEVNVQIIRLLRDTGLDTHLKADSFVASGGTDLFLSGVERTMEHGARVGVHSWSDGVREGKDIPPSSPEHRIFLDLYTELGIPEAFYWYTLEAAPAEGMHLMSDEEINRFGLVTKPIGQGVSE